MVNKKSDPNESVDIKIDPLRRGSITLRIIGQTPLYQNRMASKAMQTLLVGGKKKTSAERAEIKHDPIREFRDSTEILPDGPTALGLRMIAIKSAMCTAALETAGIYKTTAQRLLFMPGEFAPLYGTPYLKMDVVRSADKNRTPDIRTRAFLPKWGAEIDIQYVIPQLSMTSVITLLCNAGVLVGVGDFRQEKGKGAFGSFRVVSAEQDDEEWDELVAHHGRAAQAIALNDPAYYDKDTTDLMEHFFSEAKRRVA